MRAVPPVPVLREEGVVLRPLEPTDLDAYHEILSDPVAAEMVPRKPTTTRDQTAEKLRSSLAKNGRGELVAWAVTPGDLAPMIGFVALCRFDRESRRVELAYEIRRDRWGRALGRLAVSCATAYAFHTEGVHRVEAHTDPSNNRSVRMLTRAGFAREGTLREHYLFEGRFYDTAIFARLEPDPRVE